MELCYWNRPIEYYISIQVSHKFGAKRLPVLFRNKLCGAMVHSIQFDPNCDISLCTGVLRKCTDLLMSIWLLLSGIDLHGNISKLRILHENVLKLLKHGSRQQA